MKILSLWARNILLFGQGVKDDEGGGKSTIVKAIFILAKLMCTWTTDDSPAITQIIEQARKYKNPPMSSNVRSGLAVKVEDNGNKYLVGLSFNDLVRNESFIVTDWGNYKSFSKVFEPSRSDVDEEFLKRFCDSIVYVPQEHGVIDDLDNSSLFHSKDEMKAPIGPTNVTRSHAINGHYNKLIASDLFKNNIHLVSKLHVNVQGAVPMFRYGDSAAVEFEMKSMSGGQLDATLTMVGIVLAYQSKKVVILDEPGQNLGAAERSVLRRVIMQLTKSGIAQSIIVTHHVEMLTRSSIPEGLRYVNMGASTHRRKIQGEIIFSKIMLQKGLRNVLSNFDTLPVLFSRGLILVEGKTDQKTLWMIDELLQQTEIMEEFAGCRVVFKWDVFFCEGFAKVESMRTLCRAIGIDCVSIIDTDAIFSKPIVTNAPSYPMIEQPKCNVMDGIGGHIITFAKPISNDWSTSTSFHAYLDYSKKDSTVSYGPIANQIVTRSRDFVAKWSDTCGKLSYIKDCFSKHITGDELKDITAFTPKDSMEGLNTWMAELEQMQKWEDIENRYEALVNQWSGNPDKSRVRGIGTPKDPLSMSCDQWLQSECIGWTQAKIDFQPGLHQYFASFFAKYKNVSNFYDSQPHKDPIHKRSCFLQPFCFLINFGESLNLTAMVSILEAKQFASVLLLSLVLVGKSKDPHLVQINVSESSNLITLATQAFDTFTWPAEVADCEGLYIDKSLRNVGSVNIVSVSASNDLFTVFQTSLLYSLKVFLCFAPNITESGGVRHVLSQFKKVISEHSEDSELQTRLRTVLMDKTTQSLAARNAIKSLLTFLTYSGAVMIVSVV